MASIKPRKNKNGKVTSWYYSISNYPSPAIREVGFKTKKEAEAAAKFIESNLLIKKQKLKLSKSKYRPKPFYFEFEQWIIKSKSKNDEKTIRAYLNSKNKVFKYFSDELLINIDEDMYQDFLNSLIDVTVATNTKLHKHIRSFVKYAYEKNLITCNFTNGAEIIGKDSPMRKAYLDVNEYNRFANALVYKEMRLLDKTMILLALKTGVRFGELCAVTWSDIDFKQQKLRIHRQWDYLKGSGYKSLKARLGKQTKAEDINERYIPLNNQLLKILLEFKNSTEYFSNPDGRLFYKNGCKTSVMSNKTFNNKLEQCLADSQIERVTAHCLRHSFATNLIALGAAKDYVQYLLGHKEYRTMEKYYVHFHEDMFEQHSEILKL